MLDPDSFEYHPGFLDPGRADGALRRLWEELQWSQRDIVLFGRRMAQPRLVAWYGDPGTAYSYSGVRLEPLSWHPVLQDLRKRLQDYTGCRFNSVLANAYRDGSDCMGWHSDDEPELGTEPVIASLSLGAERILRVRPRSVPATGQRRSQGLVSEHGSLLLMKGRCQQLYQHALPRTRRPVGLRLNLTYRWIRLQEPA